MDFHINDIQWETAEWTAPDGKIVPFEQADITEALIGMEQDRWQDDPMIEITITRWPRKVVFACIITEGIDGYTCDGDGDGVIFEPIWARKYTLLTTDRASLEHHFDKLLRDVERALSDIRDRLP